MGYICDENAIEFLTGQKVATVTFTQGRYKTKIKRLAETNPDECKIIAINDDGSLCAHIPVDWVKISPKKQISEEQRQARSEAARARGFGGRKKAPSVTS